VGRLDLPLFAGDGVGIEDRPDRAAGYFFSADTIEELAARIVNQYQLRPMPAQALRQSVERYNSFVDSGVDADFKKPRPMHKIATPPFYAAWHTPALHDSYTGIRISPSAEVIDLRGKVIPGLYACGDSSGGFGQHVPGPWRRRRSEQILAIQQP
jgi:hypothetical protein